MRERMNRLEEAGEMGLLDDAKKAWQESAGATKTDPAAMPEMPAAQRFEYDVVEIREKFLDARGSAPSDKLRSLLNERARDGWQLKNLVSAEVTGMVGKRDGWMVILERTVTP